MYENIILGLNCYFVLDMRNDKSHIIIFIL